MTLFDARIAGAACILYLLAALKADAQPFLEDSKGWFTLPGKPQVSLVLASVPSPAYYRVCLAGALGTTLRIQISSGTGPDAYLSEDSCTDLLVTDQLKITFAPDSLITNVRGRYELLGFRQALQYRAAPIP